MITPGQFYSKEDEPRPEERSAMWNRIARKIGAPRPAAIFVFDRKSFVYGMAASFVLIFAAAGVYSVVERIAERSRPPEIRADKAYQSAIVEFEELVASASTVAVSPGEEELTRLQRSRLEYVNRAITQLKDELNTRDLSPLKRRRLLELYTVKLSLLQEIVRRGGMEL